MRRLVASVALLALSACASAPRPRIMSDVDGASRGAQAQESSELAPQAHAHAAALKRQSEEAYESGDHASAQILAEQALAAYQHAFVLARLVRAERQLSTAQADLAKAKTTLLDLDEKQRRVGAEADDLELRVKVAEDAVPLLPNAPASPEREKARLDAARALTSQAELLCQAARMLDPKPEELGKSVRELEALRLDLAKGPATAPIDRAVQLRSACLRHLTAARRPASRAAPGAGTTDALLAELSRGGELRPFRDDRGVVVTLRGLRGAKGELTPEADKVLQALGRVAKAHPEFPVLVVTHSGKAGAKDDTLGKAVADALGRAGAPKVETATAGGNLPVVDPTRPGAGARNERVEVVFVAPAS